MLAARKSFSLCSLNDGTLVAVGGNAVGEAEAVQGPVAEKYTFATNEWTAVQMYGATEGLRLGTASCALVSGGILVAGGCNRMLRPVELVSKFEQSNVDIHRSSSPESAGALRGQRAPRMIEARSQFGLAELVDGRVVAVGGCANTLASSSELYDPGALSWIQVTSMPSPRTGFGCAPLPDGRLLVVGGINPTTGTYPMRNCVLRIPPASMVSRYSPHSSPCSPRRGTVCAAGCRAVVAQRLHTSGFHSSCPQRVVVWNSGAAPGNSLHWYLRRCAARVERSG